MIKAYEGLHEYGGIASITEILAMPLPFFYELIQKQVEIKKKEKERLENDRGDGKGGKFVKGKIYRNK